MHVVTSITSLPCRDRLAETFEPTCDECGERGKVMRFADLGPGGSDFHDVCLGCLSTACSELANYDGG